MDVFLDVVGINFNAALFEVAKRLFMPFRVFLALLTSPLKSREGAMAINGCGWKQMLVLDRDARKSLPFTLDLCRLERKNQTYGLGVIIA